MNFTRSFLTKIPNLNNSNNSKLFIIHKPESIINISSEKNKKYNLNKFALNSLNYDNDAKRRAVDEAVSIHIITEKLKSKLKIMYESQIPQFYGKPDVIIRLGKDFYIIVSITRAIQKNSIFDDNESYRLVKKKMDGLYICSNNLDCLVNDVLFKYRTQSIVHILAPDITCANLCLKSYKKYCYNFPEKQKKIKLLISIINFTTEIIS